MPIEHVWGADPTLQALAAAQGSSAAVAAEQDWRNRQLAEQQFQSDRDYDYRLGTAALQDRLARYEMGNRTALGFAGLQSQNQNNQLDYMLGQQQLAQRDEQLGVQAAVQMDSQAQQTSRTQLSQLGQIARQQQQQKFENAMAARKHVEDFMRSASPRQAAQAQQGWEKQFGMAFGAPEEAMAAQDAEETQARREQWLGMLQAPDGSEELIVPENVADMLMAMEPEKAMNSYTKMLDTWQRRKKDEQSAQTTQMQWEETVANMKRDDERAAQLMDHTQQSAEQKMAQAEMLHQQKLQQSARLAFNKAKSEWLNRKNDPLATDTGPEPTPEEYGVVEEGKIITNKAGRKARLHPDGSVTPID